MFIYFLFRGSFDSYKFYLERLRQIAPYLHRSDLSPPVQCALQKFQSDILFMIAVSKAVAGFVFIRLMLGFFGMDMFEIYWWFAMGLTIVLLNLCGKMGQKAKLLDFLIEADEGSHATS